MVEMLENVANTTDECTSMLDDFSVDDCHYSFEIDLHIKTNRALRSGTSGYAV